MNGKRIAGFFAGFILIAGAACWARVAMDRWYNRTFIAPDWREESRAEWQRLAGQIQELSERIGPSLHGTDSEGRLPRGARYKFVGQNITWDTNQTNRPAVKGAEGICESWLSATNASAVRWGTYWDVSAGIFSNGVPFLIFQSGLGERRELLRLEWDSTGQCWRTNEPPKYKPPETIQAAPLPVESDFEFYKRFVWYSSSCYRIGWDKCGPFMHWFKSQIANPQKRPTQELLDVFRSFEVAEREAWARNPPNGTNDPAASFTFQTVNGPLSIPLYPRPVSESEKEAIRQMEALDAQEATNKTK